MGEDESPASPINICGIILAQTKGEVRKISDKHTRTVNVYPEISGTDMRRIFKTRELYAKVFNEYAQWFCDNKSLNVNQAHHCLYHKQRIVHPELPSGLLQSARDKAKVAVKSYNSRNPKSRFSKVPQYRSQSMSYKKTTSSLNTQGEFKFSLGYGKRVKVGVNIPKYFTDRYGNFEYQSSNIGIDKNGRFFIGLSFVKDKNPTEKQGKIVGIDRGIYNLVTTSEGMNISSSKVRGVKRKREHQIKTLKEKIDSSHSRSAKRRLITIYGKESRFIRDVNHCLSKSLVEDSSVKTYVLEDLTNIKFNKKKFPKKFRKLLHNWSPSQLAQFLEYKCELNGINIEYVDPRYTSQTCNKCGKVDKSQRKGHQYVCSCGNVDHADINAAKNIRDKVTTLPS